LNTNNRAIIAHNNLEKMLENNTNTNTLTATVDCTTNSVEIKDVAQEYDTRNTVADVDESTSFDSCRCTTDVYLQKTISVFASATASVPSGTLTISQLLDDCKDGTYREAIEVIRGEADEKQRDALKKKLPAVTLQSEPCGQRKQEFCKNNAIVCLDFDDIGNVEQAKQAIATVPYTTALAKELFLQVGFSCVVCV